jgi:aryl sulfotransferase
MAMIRPPLREYRTWASDSRRWESYRPRRGDIIIAAASKSGTTWMQQIVSSLVFCDALARPLSHVSPWIDARFRGSADHTLGILAAQTHRRFLKTHLPVDGLPLYDEVLYIHVARDGRDALMSAHNHLTGLSDAQLAQFDQIGLGDPAIGKPFPRIPAEPAAYFRLWITTPAIAGQGDGLPHPSYFDTEVGYWAERKRPNFLFVHYSDLLADRAGEMRRIASFLDITIAERLWPALVRAAGFDVMRTAGEQLMPSAAVRFKEGARRFFNQGANGRWRGVLGDGDLALYHARVREKFTPGLARWLEGGRRLAGDPRDAAD